MPLKTSSPLVPPASAHSLTWEILSFVTFPWTTTLLLSSATTAVKGRLWPFTPSSSMLWEYLGKVNKGTKEPTADRWQEWYWPQSSKSSFSPLLTTDFKNYLNLLHQHIWARYIFPWLTFIFILSHKFTNSLYVWYIYTKIFQHLNFLHLPKTYCQHFPPQAPNTSIKKWYHWHTRVLELGCHQHRRYFNTGAPSYNARSIVWPRLPCTENEDNT